VFSLLTLNIQATALPRARLLWDWLNRRDEDMIVLTETSSGPGSRFLAEHAEQAGNTVIHQPQPGERGCLLISRIPIQARPDLTHAVSAPGRVVAATLPDHEDLAVIGVYVPSSDRAPDKVIRKQTFVTTLLAAIAQLPPAAIARLVLAGDYNVIARDHQPAYRGFLPFEYGMLDTLDGLGLVDAHHHHRPGVQAHSWIGRGGNGYCFDYIHLGPALLPHLRGCDYLHEPRDQRLTDHAALTATLALPTPVPAAGQVAAARISES
jgi:exodeoxyribonuclease-3